MSAADRDRSIREAVLTSCLSKAGTALLQLCALPVAMRVLGWEEFGLYASVAGLLMVVQLFEVGLGPALVHDLSRAAAGGERSQERRLSSTSFFLLLALTLAGGTLMALVIALVPLERLFGARFAPFEATLRPALWTGLGLFILTLLLNHTDRLREGHLESRINNAWGAAGNFLAAAAVGIGVWVLPSVSFLLLAVYGSQVLARLGNTLALWRQRPWLIPRLRHVHWALSGKFVSDGLAYAVFATVVNFVEFNVCLNLFGRVAGPSGVTAYSVLITITTALLGFVLMITTPTWPAVVDARARGDFPWIRTASRRLFRYVLGFAAAAGLGLIALGPVLLPIWVGDKAHALDRPVLIAYAIYFLLFAWRHAHHMLLVGVGRVRTLAGVQLAESALVLAAAWLGMVMFGLGGLLLGMSLAIAAVTGWALPALFWRVVRRGDRQPVSEKGLEGAIPAVGVAAGGAAAQP